MTLDDGKRVRTEPAERVDRAGGYRETLEFFGSGDDLIAGCTHLPIGPARGGVVMCPSLYNEFMKNYRREVVLARALAGRGIAVQRFSYRGTGNSDGAPEDTTFESMRQDALDAVARLTDEGIERPAIMGTRFGAVVAAEAAIRSPGAPLALFEPVLRADRFFVEGLRAKAAEEIAQSRRGGSGATPGDFVDELEREGAVDVLGYTMGRKLYHSAAGHDVVDLLGSEPRPILVVQLGEGSLRRALEGAITAWREAGFAVDFEQVGEREQWWFAEERDQAPGEAESEPQGLDVHDPIIETIARWLDDKVGSSR